jgi:AcrR family transcriptional regulator
MKHSQSCAGHTEGDDRARQPTSKEIAQMATLPTTRKAKAEESRRKLVAAAIALFSEHDYDEVAVSDIAESAGVAHGLMFHYFNSKRGIYLAAMREAARALDLVHRVPPDLAPREQVRNLFRAHLRYMVEHRDLAMRLILGGRGNDPETWAMFEENRWRRVGWTCDLLGLDSQRPSVQMMLRSAGGAVDEATVYWLQHCTPFDIDLMAETFVDLVAVALRNAACLDPGLDVEAALALMR